PRIDLRPAAEAGREVPLEYASFSRSPAAVSLPPVIPATPLLPANGEPSFRTAPQESSHYQRAATSPALLPAAEAALSRQPPPLITANPDHPGYVHERLDRASQGLVSSVGSYLVDAASELRRLPEPATAQLSTTAPPEI